MKGKSIRHLHRYREIVACLVRNGFGYLVEELGLWGILSLPRKVFPRSKKEEQRALGIRVRLVLEELGPTFIKLGQMLSTRSDLLPDSIIAELNRLQDQVLPFSSQEVRKIIQTELEGVVEEIFVDFSSTPLAAASIGQVHTATLKTGEKVVVKVQRPDIVATITADLEILADLAAIAEGRLEMARYYRVAGIAAEFSRSLKAELNYILEARNAERFAALFASPGRVAAPRVFWDYTTARVITLQYLQGLKISDTEDLKLAGFDLRDISIRLIDIYLEQVLLAGFFHGDPHPGNIMVLPDGIIAFTDFGLMGRLSPSLRRDIISLLTAVTGRDADGIVRALTRIGDATEQPDPDALRRDVEKMLDKYFDLPLAEISFGEALYDLSRLGYYHHIQIPADLALLGKATVTLEGVIEKLYPQVGIGSMAVPFRNKLLRAKFAPPELVGALRRHVSFYKEFLLALPRDLGDLLQIMKKGRLRLEIDLPSLKLLVHHMDRIGNRLSFSIVLLSFSIIMTGLIIGSSLGGRPVLFGVPAIEIGFVVAAIMFFWLLFAIFRSGRF